MKQLPNSTEILSPLKEILTDWSQCVGSHPDMAFSSYIVTGIANGFQIGYHSSITIKHKIATHNLLSAMVYPKVVEKYLEGECHVGRLIGPLVQMDLPGIHRLPFRVIPKKGQNTWSLILDLSSLKRRRLKNGIDEELATLLYVNVD